MGSVFRARDTSDGQPVALKLMQATTDATGARRFMREAELLAELRHPGIVAHVAHGLTDDRSPFLAMEWLEGEDLAQRLERQPLSLTETLLLLRRTAEALAVAHGRSIIHRDLKPSNLFLRQGRVEDVVVLDFGLARRLVRSQVLTGKATLLGTPQYMAPEQASSQSDLTPAADIFSLGCVLYECLTGQPAFSAPHLVAVLAKILFAEPPPLHTLRHELPSSLQRLVDRMLAKEPQQRLPDAMGVLEALARLEDTGAPRQDTRPEGVAGAEQQLVSVLLVVPPRELPAAPLWGQPPGVESPQVPLRPEVLEHLRTTFSSHGARLATLADGSLLVTLLPERGAATDQAALAARCALSIRERWPEAAIILATGRGLLGQQQPVGEVMDRAGLLLRQLEPMPSSSTRLLLDEVTAGLLGPGFELARAGSGAYLLQGERLEADESRMLLGRPTPCVGRERELSLLELALSGCVEDATSRALLVTAPAGVGKSRLRHEFLRRVEKKGQQVQVLLGRGDPMRTGSAYGLIGQAVRRLCTIQDVESMEANREKLRQRVGRGLPEGEAQALVEFLGELCGIPFPDEDSPRLRAARLDPKQLSSQVGRAFAAFLRAESARCPVLLVLEDLHWGDARSVQLVDEALRALPECPLLVLALARPEVKELFPHLWGHHLQELVLRGLSQKASAQLAREVLGTKGSESVIERVVEQAAGNALFLEELIRMAADGQGETPPATILAMLQGRIQRMESGTRQVLLAASFFGRTFWAGGVKSLLGQERPGETLEERLRQLVESEVVLQQSESSFPSEEEYRFRHALVRDAAYSLVPESHRPAGHRQVGAWLEQLGELDPLVLAEHYQLGLERERAIPFYVRAAEQLFERDDWQAALRCVEQGRACGAGGAMRTRLRAIQALLAVWGDDNFLQAYDLGIAVLPELKPGSRAWCMLAGTIFLSGMNSGRAEESRRIAQLLLQTTPEPDALPAYIEALGYTSISFALVGMQQEAAAYFSRMMETHASVTGRDTFERAWLSLAQDRLGYFFGDNLWQTLAHAEEGARLFREMGTRPGLQIVLQVHAGELLAMMGRMADAVETLRGALNVAQQTGKVFFTLLVKTHLALTMAWSPEGTQQEEARAVALELLQEAPHAMREGMSCIVLAKVATARGEPHEAEAQARRACEAMAFCPPYRLLARGVLSASLLAQGRLPEAREEAARGVQELEQMGGGGFVSVKSYLALAEACFASAEAEAGESALRRALQCVHTRAEDLPDLALRDRLLHQVPEHARVLELARLRWGEAKA